ncbi:MAG: methylated-DNA--[protein]-cysteine S-methyltransferase [Acidobacteriia bacterium]|nr:methylated-DNA--[protein]-cysteine S-methyltransferase [Terriglobia bacterium]
MSVCTEWRNTDGPRLLLVAGGTGLREIRFQDESDEWPTAAERDDSHPLLVEAAAQLRAYFCGTLREFDLPLEMEGTDFQVRVWNLLLEIPYGETRSYREVAVALGRPQAVRAVGAANGSNPLPIVVPCHRVIGADGRLTGYGGGLRLKKTLLEMEKGELLAGAAGVEI